MGMLTFALAIATMLGGAAAVHYFWREWRALSTSKRSILEPSETSALEEKPRPILAGVTEATAFRHVSSLTLFDWRMAKAFPGLLGLAEFSGHEAADRLEVLLEPPVTGLDDAGQQRAPFWWFRGGLSTEIFAFRRLSDTDCLMGFLELPISRIASYRTADPQRTFLYVEIERSEATGAYGPERRRSEEYGIFDGHLITLEELQDGYVVLDGQSVELTNVERRVRYLEPFNFVVTGKASPINSPEFDEVSATLMPELLSGSRDLSDLIAVVESLPPREIRPDSVW